MDEGLIKKRDTAYILELVAGVADKKDELDAFIAEHAKGWTLDRINVIEKNLIRLALYEIRHMENIPYEVSVNEAIELAKRYGEDDAYSFVNGILDKARPPKTADGENAK